MSSRIIEEARSEAEDFFKLGLISKKEHDSMLKLTARDIKVPSPEVFSAKRLAKIREDINCSQKVFADIVGVTTGTISKWERGEKLPEKPVCRFLSVLEKQGVSVLRDSA